MEISEVLEYRMGTRSVGVGVGAGNSLYSASDCMSNYSLSSDSIRPKDIIKWSIFIQKAVSVKQG